MNITRKPTKKNGSNKKRKTKQTKMKDNTRAKYMKFAAFLLIAISDK